jgi:hypothetical protein
LERGTVNPKDAAVIQAIAERNMRQSEEREAKAKAKAEADAARWPEEFDKWCKETFPDKAEREIAKDAPSDVIRFLLHDRRDRGEPDPPAPDDDDEGAFDFDALAWCKAIVEAVRDDLAGFRAEHERWETELKARDDLIHKRAEKLRTETGIYAYAAEQMARQLTTDVVVMPPSWASLIVDTDAEAAPPELMDDDTLDLALESADRQVRALRRKPAA